MSGITVDGITVSDTMRGSITVGDVSPSSGGGFSTMLEWAIAKGATDIFEFADATEYHGNRTLAVSNATLSANADVIGCVGRLTFASRTATAIPSTPEIQLGSDTDVSICIVQRRAKAHPSGVCASMLGSGRLSASKNPGDIGYDSVSGQMSIVAGTSTGVLIARLSSIQIGDVVISVVTMSGTTQSGYIIGTGGEDSGDVTRAVGPSTNDGWPLRFSGNGVRAFTNSSFDLHFGCILDGVVLTAEDVAEAAVILEIA